MNGGWLILGLALAIALALAPEVLGAVATLHHVSVALNR